MFNLNLMDLLYSATNQRNGALLRDPSRTPKIFNTILRCGAQKVIFYGGAMCWHRNTSLQDLEIILTM